MACYNATRAYKDRTCERCGATLNREQHRFCSRTCANGRTANAVYVPCQTCGKTFLTPAHRAAKRLYCSMDCRPPYVPKGETAPERAVYAMLGELMIVFQRQHVIARKFRVDAFVPTANLIIQVDGDYWHGNPAKFPEPTPQQVRRRKLDMSQDAYFAKCGYRVLRVWEMDINTNPARVRQRLAKATR